MTHTIEIESIARLDIKPGEVLVVRLPQPVTREVAAEISALLAKKLPAGVETIVTSGDVRLDVVASAALRPAPTDTDWLETENVGPM